MRSIRRISKLAAGIIVGVVLSSAASAQFGGFYPGLVNLPPDDFVWNWGRYAGETGSRRFVDFSSSGGEAGFRCTLKGGLSVSNNWSSREVREFERELSTSLAFIQASANAMYALDLRREVDWAELDCDKYERDETAGSVQEDIDKARAKAERKREQRRERREREEASANDD